MTKYYKILRNGNESAHGGCFKWSVPADDQPGSWHEVEGELRLCSTGFHLTTNPAKWWLEDADCYEAEFEGETTAFDEVDCKLACRKVRLVRKLEKAELEQFQIFYSGSHEVKSGLCLAYGSSAVTAYGSSTVTAYGSSTVRACDSSTVTACDSSTVRACDSSTVRACDSSTVTACDSSTVTACDSSTVRAYGSSTVGAYGSSTVGAYGSSTVTAYGSSTVRAYGSSTVTACDSSTVRAYGSSTVGAYGSSTVGAYGSSTVTAYGSSTVTASDQAVVIVPYSPFRGSVSVSNQAVCIDQTGENSIISVSRENSIDVKNS